MSSEAILVVGGTGELGEPVPFLTTIIFLCFAELLEARSAGLEPATF